MEEVTIERATPFRNKLICCRPRVAPGTLLFVVVEVRGKFRELSTLVARRLTAGRLGLKTLPKYFFVQVVTTVLIEKNIDEEIDPV